MAPKRDVFGDDCVRPACDDMVSKLKAAASAVNTRKPSLECPANSAELGKASWTLLHSMVAWYPDKPTCQDQKRMQQFMEALSHFYPCTFCATDFRESIGQSPVRTESRTQLCTWLCEEHNKVNVKLGKSSFPCDIKTLDARWRYNPKCGDSDISTHN